MKFLSQKEIAFALAISVFVLFPLNGMTAEMTENYTISGPAHNQSVRLNESGRLIGRVIYDAKGGQYRSFAFLPFAIVPQRAKSITEFLAHLNRMKVEKNGYYYLDKKTGECGYFSTSSENQWNKGSFFALYPELAGIIHDGDCMKALAKVKLFPPGIRTHGNIELMNSLTNITDIPAVKCQTDSCPGKELEALKKEELNVKPDEAAIRSKFAKLLEDKKFMYHQQLNEAAKKNDTKRIVEIAQNASGEYMWEAWLCGEYAALYGRADAALLAGQQARFESDAYGKQAALAMYYFKKAIQWGGCPEASRMLAWMLERRIDSDDKEIFRLYKEAMDHGDKHATIEVACCYWVGLGTPRDRKKSFALAKTYLETHPTSPYAKLFTGLGYFYLTGERDRGLKLIDEAADVIDLAALYRGCIDEFGLNGIPQRLGYAANFSFPGDSGETRYYELNDVWMKPHDRRIRNIVTPTHDGD